MNEAGTRQHTDVQSSHIGPSFTAKFKGKAEKAAEKIAGNDAMMQRGEERQPCPGLHSTSQDAQNSSKLPVRAVYHGSAYLSQPTVVMSPQQILSSTSPQLRLACNVRTAYVLTCDQSKETYNAVFRANNMRVSFILAALAAFAVAAPIPTAPAAAAPADTVGGKILDGAIKVAKVVGQHAADEINGVVQKHWSEEAIAAKNAKKEKVTQSAAEVKLHGLSALKTAGAIGKGLAVGSAGKKSYLNQE
ncbi:hypothetical protein CCMSSC00406_0000741 [Pleurotus cornucopiae]|uniref:Uncharacterized protein n=1 Tax=Pleurotus cornucopiae TaxID=5321 RepID=A0ACB7JCJ9_PLECO|nr:hypothetical protein CCMSSC00406_0000741 [Pleurotus cornucopiae]